MLSSEWQRSPISGIIGCYIAKQRRLHRRGSDEVVAMKDGAGERDAVRAVSFNAARRP
jgi:hypothetical protein